MCKSGVGIAMLVLIAALSASGAPGAVDPKAQAGTFEELYKLAAADRLVKGGAAYANKSLVLLRTAALDAFSECSKNYPDGQHQSTTSVLEVNDAGVVTTVALSSETGFTRCMADNLGRTTLAKPPRAPFHVLFDEYIGMRQMASSDRRGIAANAYASGASLTVRKAMDAALSGCLANASNGRHLAFDFVLTVNSLGEPIRLALKAETDLGVCLVDSVKAIRLGRPPKAPFRIAFDDDPPKLAAVNRSTLAGALYLGKSLPTIRVASAEAIAKCSIEIPSEKHQTPTAVLVIDAKGTPKRVFAPGSSFTQCFADKLQTLKLTAPPIAPFQIAFDSFGGLQAQASTDRSRKKNRIFVKESLTELHRLLVDNFVRCSKAAPDGSFAAMQAGLVLDANGRALSVSVKPLDEMNGCIGDAFDGSNLKAPPTSPFHLVFDAFVTVGAVGLTTGHKDKTSSPVIKIPAGQQLCNGLARQISNLGFNSWTMEQEEEKVTFTISVETNTGRGRAIIRLTAVLLPRDIDAKEFDRRCDSVIEEIHTGNAGCDCSCVDPDGTVRAETTVPSAGYCHDYCLWITGSRAVCESRE